jgi:O-antigen/teichoic acid export membrane protein
LKLIFVFTQAPLIAFVLMMAMDFLLASVFLIYFYTKKTKISFKQWKVRLDVIKSLLKDGWPLILSGFAIMICVRIDQVMIGSMIGERELGIYSAAVKISEAWYAIPTIITISVFPAIIYIRNIDKNLYFKRFQILYDGFFWFTISIALIITFISTFIINILYGIEYAETADILSVHIWAGVFGFWGYINGRFVIAENLTKLMLYITFSGAVINVLLNLWVIPVFGPIGAAFTTLISQLLSCTILIAIFPQTRILFKMQLKALNIFRILKYFK